MPNQTVKPGRNSNENKVMLLGIGIFVVTLFFVFTFSVLISYRSRALNGMGDSPSSRTKSKPSSNAKSPLSPDTASDTDNFSEKTYDFSQDVVTNSDLEIPNNTHVKGKITVNGGDLKIGHNVTLEEEVQVFSKGEMMAGKITIGNNVTAKTTIQTTQGSIQIGSNNKLKDVLIKLDEKYPVAEEDTFFGYLEAESNNEFGTVEGQGRVYLRNNNIVLGDLKASQGGTKFSSGQEEYTWQSVISIENNNKIYGNVICNLRFKTGSNNQVLGKNMCQNSSSSSSNSFSSSTSGPTI